MKEPFRITGEALLLALDYLDFIASINGYTEEWRGVPLTDHKVVVAISADKMRGFQTEVPAIKLLFERGFEVEPDMRPGPDTEAVRSWRTYFEQAGWMLIRAMLDKNKGVLRDTLLDIEPLLDPSRLTMERGTEHTEAFQRFLSAVADGKVYSDLQL